MAVVLYLQELQSTIFDGYYDRPRPSIQAVLDELLGKMSTKHCQPNVFKTTALTFT